MTIIKMDDAKFLDYRGKIILAPMIKVSNFPMRAMCLSYGADLVYNEELKDENIIKTNKTYNTSFDTIDFVRQKRNEKVIFRTKPGENVVFQLGTADAVKALRASMVVANDVKGIDINMGCPLKFSVNYGMGAALLEKPDIVYDIISTLKRNLNVPVSCKVRVFESAQKSVDLLRNIEKAGADAITIRPYFVNDRKPEPARTNLVKTLAESINIPAIYNGDIFEQNQIERAKKMTNCDSVMIARGAMWNPSIFRKEGFLPLNTVVSEYFNTARKYENPFWNTKDCLHKILGGNFVSSDSYRALSKSSNYNELSEFVEYFSTEEFSLIDNTCLDITHTASGLARITADTESDKEKSLMTKLADNYTPFVFQKEARNGFFYNF